MENEIIKLIKYLEKSNLELFNKDYIEGYRDCINDIKRYNFKSKIEK